MRTERSENAAGTWVHQGDAHHRKLPAQRSVLDQYREALLFQPLDSGQKSWIFRQHFMGPVRHRDFAFDDLALDRTLEYLRQTLHLRFGQGIARRHAIAEVEVFDQVGGEIDHLAVRLAYI